jgi:uncharacterized membrane protein YfcA
MIKSAFSKAWTWFKQKHVWAPTVVSATAGMAATAFVGLLWEFFGLFSSGSIHFLLTSTTVAVPVFLIVTAQEKTP